jgi:hypothetical protein
MRQDREREAGNEKHSHAEHRVWIFDRHTCSLVCFVIRCGPKMYLTPHLLRFSFVLDRIVHLPVPSENLSRRGKRLLLNGKVLAKCESRIRTSIVLTRIWTIARWEEVSP